MNFKDVSYTIKDIDDNEHIFLESCNNYEDEPTIKLEIFINSSLHSLMSIGLNYHFEKSDWENIKIYDIDIDVYEDE